ncbi:trypsin-like serine protease [Neoconidiobolus thromboides FSU 785]|nr:trypsin-like serine protease [Neoconidiobolus thromboides FSU 785]
MYNQFILISLLFTTLILSKCNAPSSTSNIISKYSKPKPKFSQLTINVTNTNNNSTEDTNSNDSRIIGGFTVTTRKYPFLVSIQDKSIGHLCGGTIMNSQLIITAGHCLIEREKESMRIKYGDNELKKMKYELSILQLIIHPNYNKLSNGEVINDIGLIQFNKEDGVGDGDLSFISNISSNDLTLDNELVKVVGWGYTEEDGIVSNELNEVDLTTLNTNTCKQHWKYINSYNTICAWKKEGGKDGCQGDSGGPLLLLNSNTNEYTIIGIISNGIGCGEKEMPSVYTRIYYYKYWLQQVTMNYDLEDLIFY